MPEQRPCPKCGAPVDAGATRFPFCSSRCQLLDLGAWVTERYRVPDHENKVEETASQGGDEDDQT
ncbi:MAG: DNA gyrase inhibitor YacG [Oligoflexia bacterium]|nr:DNA gyrase inhibitor YacG [Oligoflexia bacterium]